MAQVEKVDPSKNMQRQKPQHAPVNQHQGADNGVSQHQIVDNPLVGGGAMSVNQAIEEDKGLWLQRKGEAPEYRSPFLVQMHGAEKIQSPHTSFPPPTVSRNFLQQKLQVGQPNDQYEKEADRVAEHVVHGKSKQPSEGEGELKPGGEAKVQPKRKTSRASESPKIQRNPNSNATSTLSESRLQARKGGGTPLTPETQNRMEGAIGADFSQVRVHTDGEAKEMNKDLNAQAFTHGNDIYFNEGKYNPGTAEGDRLLAHELTHTVQQGAAPIQNKEQENPQTREEAPASRISKNEADPETVQAKVEYPKTNDGDAPRQRLEQKQQEELSADELAAGRKKSKAEAKKEAAKADPSEKAKKRKETTPLAKPNVDNPGRQKEKTQEASKQTKTKVDHPEELSKKEKDGKEKKKAKKQEVTAEATDAEALKTAALAAAEAVEEPREEAPVEPPAPVDYKDKKGNPLPPDSEAEVEAQQLVSTAQMIRTRGYAFRKEAMVAMKQAFSSEATWLDYKKNLSISEYYLDLGGKNIGQRKTMVADAEQAHLKSEERADTVLKEVPKKLEETKSGLDSSGPIAQDTQKQKSENEATASDDAESREKSAEQGAGLSESGDKIDSIGTGIAGADKELMQLQEKTQEAKAKNAESKSKLLKTKADLGTIDAKVGEMNQVNKKGRKSLADMKREPGEMKKEGKKLDQQGQSLIESSREMEKRLWEAAKARQQRAQSREPKQNEGASTVQTKSNGSSGVIQRTLGDYASMRGEKDIDATPDAMLDKEELEIKARNKAELAHIKALIGDRSMADISAAEKISIGLRTRFTRFGSWVKDKFTFANVGKLFLTLINPVAWLVGGVGGGLAMIFGGIKGLVDNFGFNWATVKSLADIATGVAVVAGTIAGISIAIAAINAVLVFLTFGGWLSVAVPMAPVLANIISWSGAVAFWAGAIGLTLNLIALGKSLLDVGAVKSAEELQAQMNDVEEDSGRALQAALSMEVGAASMGSAGKMMPYQLLQGVKPHLVIAQIGGRGMALRAFFRDAMKGVGPGLLSMLTFRSTAKKLRGLVLPRKVIIISSPDQLAATKPIKVGDEWHWNLYDKKSGAVFTQYVKASPTQGPDQYLLPEKAWLPNGQKAFLKKEGSFGWTDESLRINLETYKSIYGKPAPNLSGEIADVNLAAFQKKYVELKTANPTMPSQEIGDLAIKDTPFGKGRRKAGYGNLSVRIDDYGTVNIGGVNHTNVPTDVKVEALPTVPFE